MKCKACNTNAEEGWRFCASCGASISENRNIESEIAREVGRSILSVLEKHHQKNARWNGHETGRTRGFAIKVVRSKSNIPSIEKQKSSEKNQILQKQRNDIKEIVEPKIDITRFPGKLVVDAELPEVMSDEDVNVMVFAESMEIRAHAPEKTYLKIVPTPRNMRLEKSAFIRGNLRLELVGRVRR